MASSEDEDQNLFSFSTPEELTKKRKRGRPSKILTEILATETSAGSLGHSSVPSSSTNPDTSVEPASRADAPRLMPHVPDNLMHLVVRRPHTGAQPSTGYAHTSFLLPVLLNVHDFVVEHGVQTDPDLEQMQDFNLNPNKFHLASGNLLRYLWGLEGKSLTQKLNRLAASIMLHSSLATSHIMNKAVQFLPSMSPLCC